MSGRPAGSVLIPAHNEEAVIGRCLDHLFDGIDPESLEVAVVCNGCHDGTAAAARAGGHPVHVIELDVASKTAALRAGDRALDTFPRLYLDADVVLRGAGARQVLEQLGGLKVKEIELTSFAGEPFYLARLDDRSTRIVPVTGNPARAFETERIIDLVTAAGKGRVTTRVLEQYDRYYLDRERLLPLPVVLAQATTDDETRYYIDPNTARVVRTYDPSNWVGRWLYNGLHSLNFPWLYNYRPLWDIVVITLMLGGTALCVTSLVLAWRVLGRKLARALRA